MNKGLAVSKLWLINWPKIPHMPQNLSAQIVCPSPEICDFNEKRLHWASVVRAYNYNTTHEGHCSIHASVQSYLLTTILLHTYAIVLHLIGSRYQENLVWTRPHVHMAKSAPGYIICKAGGTGGQLLPIYFTNLKRKICLIK